MNEKTKITKKLVEYMLNDIIDNIEHLIHSVNDDMLDNNGICHHIQHYLQDLQMGIPIKDKVCAIIVMLNKAMNETIHMGSFYSKWETSWYVDPIIFYKGRLECLKGFREWVSSVTEETFNKEYEEAYCRILEVCSEKEDYLFEAVEDLLWE